MTYRRLNISRVCAGLIALMTAHEFDSHGDNTWEYSVQVSATVQTAPPVIRLSWPQDVNLTPTSYTVYRKSKDATSWGSGTTLPGTATGFEDWNVAVGGAYEYQIHKLTPFYDGYGYIYAGIEAPLTEHRGKLILIVDSTHAGALSTELARFQLDLAGDGWTVLRHDVSPGSTPPSVKALIQNAYNSDPSNVKCVILFGRIPVPSSGLIWPDGHTEERGAWPADLYYGEMTSAWTDFSVNTTDALSPRRWNVPGDGKFDQSEIPSAIELQVGRIDLANMPGRKVFQGPPTFPPEVDLLRNYLNKNHAYRHRMFNLPRRGIVYDGAGAREGAGFAATAYRSYAPFFGANQIRRALDGEFLPILQTEAYLCAYANGGGDHRNIANLGGTGPFNGGTTTDIVERDIKTVFAMLFGSHLGDWNVEDNIMRAVLATPSYGLACLFAGAPHWFCHHMGLGETIGYSTRLTQNNLTNGLYQTEYNQGANLVHVALLGDPTLRLHTVAPPGNLTANAGGGGVVLNWTGAADSVLGYHIYRAPAPVGPFTRVNAGIVTATSFTDPSHSSGTYMVRAIKLESSGSGTYFNSSQGIFASAIAPADSDGDGMPDTDELIAGTDPNNPQSVLKFISAVQDSPTTLTIAWSSVPGKSYRIVFKSEPAASWTDASGIITATGPISSWTTGVANGGRLYRVRVQGN